MAKRRGNPLYFMDGVHPQHNSQPNYGWIPRGEDKALLSNTGRKRLNINGAVNIDTHDLVIRADESVNAQSTIRLLRQILKRHKDDNEIYIVCDNAAYYRSKLVRNFLEEEKKLQLIFLPAYRPFLNLIERVWKYFKKKVLYNRYYETFSEFKEACMGFFLKGHKRTFKSILTEKFHFDEFIEPLKLAC